MLITIVVFILILSLLVFVHEWGHFYTARKAGMKVYEFGFGFPPRAIGWYKDPATKKWIRVLGAGKGSLKETVGGDERIQEFPSTLYSINWLPLGGFVKIKGESGEARGETDSFVSKKIWQRLVVLVAGVTMNFLLAGVILAGVLMAGVDKDLVSFDPYASRLIENPTVNIKSVQENTPAAEAGLQSGDIILSLDGTPVTNNIQMITYVMSQGEKEIEVVLNRNGEQLTKTLTPQVVEIEGQQIPRLGVELVMEDVRLPWYQAIYQGFAWAAFLIQYIFFAILALIKSLVLGQGVTQDVGGPVAIASVVGQSARMGLSYLAYVTAQISLSLAVINILPIPALDGGRALFVIVEKIIRRPVPMKYEQAAHTIGFILLMILIVLVTVRDVRGLF